MSLLPIAQTPTPTPTPSLLPAGPPTGARRPGLQATRRAGWLVQAVLAGWLGLATVAAAEDSPGKEPARELAAALFQVQGSRLGGQTINALLGSGFLWPHAACPGRYALTVRHGVNAARVPAGGGEPVFEAARPIGARVALQMARREGRAPARVEATVLDVGPALGNRHDWALLRLDQALPARALPPERLADGPPVPGQALRLLALPPDAAAPGPEPRAVLEAPCRTTEHDAEFEGWRSSCRGAAGQSGGPMLFGPAAGPVAGQEAADWRLGGMVVTRRESPGTARAVFLSLHALAPSLHAAIDADRARRDCQLDGPGPGSATSP